MSYRERLPQLSGGVFITDGGMETTLIFQDEFDLPCFASFPLLDRADGRLALRAYFQPYIAIAREQRVGMILDAVTWRASRDWGSRLGYSPVALDAANREAVRFWRTSGTSMADAGIDIVLCGCIGPRGDAYRPAESMTAAEAESYHAPQLGTLSETAADMVAALTMTNAGEAVGIVRAAARLELPVVVSFTVETDGRLPSGQSLRSAIEQVDSETDGAAAYFMVNCAHPTHVAGVLAEGGAWTDRLRGFRTNASARSHAELDEADELDAGDPGELGLAVRGLRAHFPTPT